MPLKIVRNDITQMNTEAIINTANREPVVGAGCDRAIYNAAGYEELLSYRKEKIGEIEEGEVFITPGFGLKAEYIIHAVSPLFINGDSGEEEKLRSCYKKSLKLAKEHNIRSIAFPLISTGSFGYPREEGMRIAVDEINAFLLKNDMDIFLVVFSDTATELGKKLDTGLEEYIDRKYVELKVEEEYYSVHEMRPDADYDSVPGKRSDAEYGHVSGKKSDLDYSYIQKTRHSEREEPSAKKQSATEKKTSSGLFGGRMGNLFTGKNSSAGAAMPMADMSMPVQRNEKFFKEEICEDAEAEYGAALYSFEKHESRLEERMKHLKDTFSQYLMYLIKEKNMENAEVYKRAIVDKKIFSKIKNNAEYHPQKLTALCLCVGAKLNLDEAKDLLARAGYALSPCDKTDIIFSYFIENEIYDMIELDIQLEEHGLPCIIS